MPYLSFHISVDVSQEQSDRIAGTLTALTASVLGKKPELTAVAIHAAAPGRWYVGAERLSGGAPAGFYLEVKVTEGTNTKSEKAEYVRQVFDAVSGIVGPLAPPSYVVIHEVRADAWGYAGQTQEYRYIRGRPL